MSHRPHHGSDHESDEPFDRLRAADPAAGVTPDHTALGAAVRARVGDALPAADRRDEVAAARSRRRPRWLAVAAVTAGTLAVGSAGYALGDRPDGDLTAASSTTAAITLGQPGGPAAPAAPEAAAGGLPAGPGGARVGAESLAADSATSMPWFGGRTVFTARGLSSETGTAEAWAYDATSTFTAETATRVATALGLDGAPRQEAGAWVVGPQDGTAGSLQLYPDGLTSVAYYDPTRDPFGCPVPEPDAVTGPADTPGVAPAPDGATEEGATGEGGGSDASAQLPVPDFPTCTTTDRGPAPQGDEAVARAREVVDGTGADADAFAYEVMDAGTPGAVYVTAHALLGGQRTGVVWSMTLVGDGVQSLYGALAPLVPLGSYDVISPAAAVERLADPRFGSSGGPMMAAEGAGGAALRELSVDPSGPATSGEAPADVTTPPAPVPAGAAFAWPVSEVVLTSARLGLAQHTQPDGAAVLLPAYELSSDDGAVWSVVAVADSGLDFAAGR